MQMMTSSNGGTIVRREVDGAVFGVVWTVSACHLLNDAMQSLLPALYPSLKMKFGLSFAAVGVVTLAYQLTASLLQPLVGSVADRRPMPMLLPLGTLITLAGLLALAFAGNYPLLLAGACLLGIGSSIFHPEASRVARMAAGDRHGFVQALFQLGGNMGSAAGPLAAAFVVVRFGQESLAAFALLALLSAALLWTVAAWYRTTLASRRAVDTARLVAPSAISRRCRIGIAVLLALLFSKYVYLASLTSYFTFYLIARFGLPVASAQLHLFVFLAAVAAGTLIGGPLSDRIGRRTVIWASILGALPFTLALPYANLFWTDCLIVAIGLILASAFPTIIVYAQELMPGRVGMVSGLFFGFAFGIAGLAAAALGWAIDMVGINAVYQWCSLLPAIGLLAAFLPGSAKSDAC